MAERLFTNTTGAYGYEPVPDNTFPHTFGEFPVLPSGETIAGRVVFADGDNVAVSLCETHVSTEGGAGTIGIALDTVTGDPARPQVVKVVTAGITTAEAGDTVFAGSPVVATTGGKVKNISDVTYNIGDRSVGTALTSGEEGDTVLVRVENMLLQMTND
jgi:hypothetical protein